jgi:hypothetical protein
MQDQSYGLGSVTTGRVSGVTADTDHSFGALLNPALISATPKRQFTYSMSWVNSQIANPTNVLLDSARYRTRDGQERIGDVAMPAVRTALWAAGYSHPFALGFWPNHRAGFGLTISGPFDQFRRWVALSPYDFTPLRYGGSDTQFKGTVAGSLEIIPQHLFFGAGLSLFLTSSGVSEASLNTSNPTARMAMNVGFNTSTIFGLYSQFDAFSASLVYRQVVIPAFNQTFIGELDVGGVTVANQPAAIQTSLYYEPAIIELEAQKNFGGLVASAGLAFQQWVDYAPRYLALATPDASGRMRSTYPSITPMQNTLNPRASLEWRGWNQWRISMGYQFRPTPVVDLSKESNLIDADTHVLGFNVSRYLGNPLFFDRLTVSLFGQAHLLNPRVIVKSSPDYVGAPGYTISGQAFTVGVSFTSDI